MDVGESYDYALIRAHAGNHTDVVSLLLQSFADANVRSWCAASGMQSALIHAVKASNVEVVPMLLEFRAEPGLQARECHAESD